jgi:hypothetical protein
MWWKIVMDDWNLDEISLGKWQLLQTLLNNSQFLKYSEVLELTTSLWIPKLSNLNLYPPHTCWCGHHWTIPTSRGTFRAILASASHWLQPVLVLFVQWWPTPTGVGRVLVCKGVDRIIIYICKYYNEDATNISCVIRVRSKIGFDLKLRHVYGILTNYESKGFWFHV